MDNLSELSGFSKYFRVLKPSKIVVNKEEIFYRDKYNDIINYIKRMSIFESDNQLNEYITPKGAILINVNPGTDIIEFLKLISTKYSLELIEFDNAEIRKTPNEFIKDFLQILKLIREKIERKIDLNSKEEIKESLIESDKQVQKHMLIINQQLNFKTLLGDKNLLELFTSLEKRDYSDFIGANIIVVWINYDMHDILEISSEVYEYFDIFVKVQILSDIERETVFRDFLEKNPKIVFDINALVNYTDNWEVNDIKQLLRVGIFKHFLNSELNETSNEITHVLLDLIESGEFLPSNVSKISNTKPIVEESEKNQHISPNLIEIEEEKLEKIYNLDDYIKSIRGLRTSEFMLNQLYENAAFLNYNELLLIIDKINKKEPLEENDRILLAKYPFILTESSKRALVNLEKAKKRIDRIKQAFGK